MRLSSADVFSHRHIGPQDNEIREMLKFLGFSTLEELISHTVPASIRAEKPLSLPPAMSEHEVLQELRAIASQNKVFRSYIGMGYSDTITPPVILRNIMENPGWYTQYTPYQAEIAQGRLEALLNFQTMIMDLTKMEIANSSMLDEATSATEAISLCYNVVDSKNKSKVIFVSEECHPQTIEVVKTRADALGLEVIVGDHRQFSFTKLPVFAVLLQYPASDGAIYDYSEFIKVAHEHHALAVVAADLLSLVLLKAPGEFGADVVVGNSQRFGVPLGYGGPHAAFFATREAFKRSMPGRLVGVSQDAQGKPALRLALQTREQHIRRAKATSNICTAQVLLAVMASMYAVYHGPVGMKRIATRVSDLTKALATALKHLGVHVKHQQFFDTLRVELAPNQLQEIWDRAQKEKINFRTLDEKTLGISLDETTTVEDVLDILNIFTGKESVDYPLEKYAEENNFKWSADLIRQSDYLNHPVFSRYHSETEMLRYMAQLQSKDLSLAISMIPLGSCTMKLNATTEMIPVTWPEFSKIHPYVPLEQAEGYKILIDKLEAMLCEITGFSAVSLQPNAGSQGEYTGLLVIKKFHEKRGEGHRNLCLIPDSAHGTNPASAVMAGMEVIGVGTDSQGNINLDDLKMKVDKYKDRLSCLMVTYPSTHGVFEESIIDICKLIHSHGGQVYMDGANMNAQVGLCRPGDIGADVCHLNLHKTFCIPHGGGGPGMGPIGVGAHLAAYLPSHPVIAMGGKEPVGAVSAAPWGSPSILPISYIYILLMGEAGLRKATEVAILNANYIAKKLSGAYPVVYKGREGLIAHECIIDLRPLKVSGGVEVDDVAKRLMDYGFHAPTVSWPVAGTMMIEPTESESKRELDRFCDAMIAIRKEVKEIEDGKVSREINVLKGAPHTAQVIISDRWDRPYSREQAAFPAPYTREFKFWPAVSRIDNPFGDRNLVCACPPVSEY